MTQDNVNPHDDQMKLMGLLMEQAEEGTLHGFLDFVAGVRGGQLEEGSERQRKDRKRWCSYRAKVRLRYRRKLDVMTLLWGSALISALDRAYEGGRQVTMHISHGRKPPTRNVARDVSDLLRQSGLKARIRYHTPNATVLSVSF